MNNEKELEHEIMELEVELERKKARLDRLRIENTSVRYMLNEFGQICEIFPERSHGHEPWKKAVKQNNSFKTIEDAEKERDRRALLYEFNQFKDKCNKEKEIEFNSRTYKEKFCICIIYNELDYIGTEKGTFFPLFGYFYDREHCLEAIKKFGDRIKRLYVD